MAAHKTETLPLESHHLIKSLQEKDDVLDFVSNGIGCFAFTLIQGVGILDILTENGRFEEKDLTNPKKFKNPIAIKSALLSLCLCNLLIYKDGSYFLTKLGAHLADKIGLLTMLFEGYGELFANGVSIARGKTQNPAKYINGASVAFSSIQFGEKAVDPVVVDTIHKLRTKGTVCDLGCGSAHRLTKICQTLSLPGLGLDADHEAVKLAKNLAKENSSIEIEQADVTQLDGVWEDVEVVMQNFMTHDIAPEENCIQTLRSYKNNFPHMKYFIIVDIVAPPQDFSSHMPGYDYVHGLLGIETRTYEQTTSLFSRAGYKFAREIKLDMPNTYLWVLKPQRN